MLINLNVFFFPELTANKKVEPANENFHNFSFWGVFCIKN